MDINTRQPEQILVQKMLGVNMFISRTKNARTVLQGRMVKKSVLIENKGDLGSPHSGVNLTLGSGLLVS